MGYIHINNLYRSKEILMMKKGYSLEKIHGTSANIHYDGVKTLRFFSGGASHELFVKLFDEEKLLKKFQELFNEPVTVYGEAYGGKMQGMSATYGKDLKFVAFDVKIGKCWLDVLNANDVTIKLGLEFVDYKLITTTLKNIDAERDRDSTQAIRNGMGSGKLREGIVLRPLIELTKNNGERLMCKHKRDEFRETKTPRIVSDKELQILKDADKIAEEWTTAERLRHILDKIQCKLEDKSIGLVIKAMVEDIYREGKDELVESSATNKAIAKKTVKLFKNYMMKNNK